MQNFKWFFILVFLSLLSACGEADQTDVADNPAAPSVQPPSSIMVSVANPHAAEAAMEILVRGGTAIDAAIAAQAVLGLVEPQSSGIGGGGFLLYFDAATGDVQAYDGREMAPRATRPEHFLGPDGRPRGFADIVRGGTAVGVPGVMAMLDLVHEEHGRLAWDSLFDQGIELAEEGFVISPRMRLLMDYAPWTAQMPDAVAYLYDEEGAIREAGSTLRNPDYADSLRLIASEGAAVLYTGALGEAIVERVTGSQINPGAMTLEDLAAYRALEREAICSPYREFQICGMPPPTSGGVTLQMILGLLERFDLAKLEPGSARAVHLISEASRLAYADRAMYLADPDFVAVPLRGLLSESYLAQRGQMIDESRSMGVAEAGNPWPDEIQERAPDITPDVPGTSHFAIIDSYGNAVSMSTTVESIFGSHLMVGGFFLNNQMTDFSSQPQRDGFPIANALAPGKRPRSSLSPTIILDENGDVFALMGSAGGSRIPAYILQTTIALIDWDLSMSQALALPHHVNRNGAVDLEAGTDIAEIAPVLQAMGHEVRITRLNSGTHGIRVYNGIMDGGADPRREGVVLSD